jgi:hypothetical protein
MKRTLLLLVICVAAAGCQAQADAWQAMALPSTNYDQVFQAAREVLAEDYTVARADPAAGVIETLPKRFQKTGSERTLGAYLSSGEGQSYRRTVTCHVQRGDGGTVVEVRADLAREGTSQAQTLLIETEGADQRMAGGERRWDAGDPHKATYWSDVGRDEETENALLQKIRDRLAAPATPAAPAPPAAM